MAVFTKKDEVDLKAKLTELNKPVGNAGAAMLAANTPQEQFSMINAGRRNLIINGETNIWQRGTTVNTVSFGNNGADRWTSHATVNCSRQTFTPGQTEVPGEPQYYSRHTAVGTAMGFGQKIEDVRTGAGQYVTFSFWARASQPHNADALFRQRFGTGGSSTVFDDYSGVFKLDTEWKYFTWTHKFDSIFNRTIGQDSEGRNDSFTEVGIYVPVTSANEYIDFTRVQVEIGKTATPFEIRPIAEDLQLCKRYYEKSYAFDTTPAASNTYEGAIFFTSATSSNGYHYEEIRFEVEKRAKPSVTLYSSSDGTSGVWFSHQDNQNKTATATHGLGTKGVRVAVQVASGYRTDGHFAADAEL